MLVFKGTWNDADGNTRQTTFRLGNFKGGVAKAKELILKQNPIYPKDIELVEAGTSPDTLSTVEILTKTIDPAPAKPAKAKSAPDANPSL